MNGEREREEVSWRQMITIVRIDAKDQKWNLKLI